VLATLFIPEIVEEDPPPFDLIGFILSGVGLSALVWASATMEGDALPVWAVWVLFVIGFVGVALYAMHAVRTPNPILDLRLFRLPTFKAGVIGGSFFRIGVGAIPLLWPLLLQLGFGLSPLQSGLMTFVGAVGAMLMKFTASPILRRLGFRRVLVVNVIITAIFGVAPASFTITSPHLWILTVFFIGGFFRSLQFTCINAISVAEVEQPEMSQATTLTSVFQQLSLSLGITIAAFILQSSMALRGSQTLATGDFLPAFVVIAAISLLSYFGFASLPPNAGEELARRKRVASAAVAIANGRSYGRS
jgi:MFS family permease